MSNNFTELSAKEMNTTNGGGKVADAVAAAGMALIILSRRIHC